MKKQSRGRNERRKKSSVRSRAEGRTEWCVRQRCSNLEQERMGHPSEHERRIDDQTLHIRRRTDALFSFPSCRLEHTLRDFLDTSFVVSGPRKASGTREDQARIFSEPGRESGAREERRREAGRLHSRDPALSGGLLVLNACKLVNNSKSVNR